MSFKIVIRTLTLLLCLVVLYILAVILYSVKYWPDVRNYLNGNITIKRIPTLSELNISNVEKDFGYVSATTDGPEDYADSTTDSILLDIFLNDYTTTSDDLSFAQFMNERSMKFKYINDYDTLPSKPVIVDYFFDYKDDDTEIKDILNEKRLTTRSSKDVEVFGVESNASPLMPSRHVPAPLPSVYPWVVAIYIKRKGSDQFEYFCDGALLSDRCILTAARCVWRGNQTLDTNELITILGKQNLKVMKFEERITRINQITVHPNFSIKKKEAVNDLAILHMENAVIFSDRISPARLENDEDNGDIVKAATTGWAYSGQLTPIYFEQQVSDNCKSKTKGAIFCATYGQDVSVCPSYGGLFVIKMSSRWYLHGIASGEPTHRGACFGKDVLFTSLSSYYQWIQNTLQLKYI